MNRIETKGLACGLVGPRRSAAYFLPVGDLAIAGLDIDRTDLKVPWFMKLWWKVEDWAGKPREPYPFKVTFAVRHHYGERQAWLFVENMSYREQPVVASVDLMQSGGVPVSFMARFPWGVTVGDIS